MPCFSATLSATRPKTLCFVSVSPLVRLRAFYLFYESDCRYKTDTRFPENLQRFALCCTLCCADVALRCTETPQFLLHRCPMQNLIPPDYCARNPVQRKASKAFTQLHFWVWKHDMVLVPRGGFSLVLRLGTILQLSSMASAACELACCQVVCASAQQADVVHS